MRAAGRIDREEGSHLYPSSAFESGNLETSCRMARSDCIATVCCVQYVRMLPAWLSFPRQFECRLTALKAFGHVFIGIVDISQSSEGGQREGKRAAEALLGHIHTCAFCIHHSSPIFPLSICPYHNIKYQPTTHSVSPPACISHHQHLYSLPVFRPRENFKSESSRAICPSYIF